jgi:hypothetical protein
VADSQFEEVNIVVPLRRCAKMAVDRGWTRKHFAEAADLVFVASVKDLEAYRDEADHRLKRIAGGE